MSPRTGRPKIGNPKVTKLTVRLDEENFRKLDAIAEFYNETRAEALRHGVNTLFSKIKK